MSQALPTGEMGYQCPNCDYVFEGEPDYQTFYRCDPDYVDHDLSNSAWTYYTSDTQREVEMVICENSCQVFADDSSVQTGKTWRCGDCGSLHLTKGNADACC